MIAHAKPPLSCCSPVEFAPSRVLMVCERAGLTAKAISGRSDTSPRRMEKPTAAMIWCVAVWVIVSARSEFTFGAELEFDRLKTKS